MVAAPGRSPTASNYGDFSLDDDAPEATKPRQAPDPKAQAQRFEQQVRAAANATAANASATLPGPARIAVL